MISPASPFHAAALARIHGDAFPPAQAWSEAALATLLAAPVTFGLVDARGGFALARVVADEAELLTIAVTPGLQRGGIGHRLLSAIIETAATRGARCMFLEVSDRNLPAQALYRRLGYLPVGRRARYYADGADALLLRRAL